MKKHLLVLTPLIVLSQFISIGFLVFTSKIVVLDIGLIFQALFLAFGVWAIKSVGEQNWSVYPLPNSNSSVSNSGPYNYVRHPMYTTLIFFFLPMVIRENNWYSWLFYGILGLTLILKISFEEKQLIAKHPEYQDFKLATKYRLIPFVW